MEGFLTYNGWGRQHYICAGAANDSTSTGSAATTATATATATAAAAATAAAPLANLSEACSLLSYRWESGAAGHRTERRIRVLARAWM